MKAAEEYLSCLTEFATLIELPLLIAWNFRGLWLLVDHVHFAKKQRALHLSIETAFQEDLMCLLFRDVRICLNPKLQLFFEWKILDPIVLTRDEDIPQNFRATFLKAGYSHEGISLQRHPRESLHLFLAAPHEEQVLRVDDHTIRQVIRPVGESLFSLSRVLASELALGEAQNTVDWHQVLRSGALPSSGAHYRESLQASQEDGIILQWWDTQPRTLPSFLV